MLIVREVAAHDDQVHPLAVLLVEGGHDAPAPVNDPEI
jgi:hypothetical protein